jgi:integrase
LTLKWAYVDLERRLLLLPDSKTGQKAIVLNNAAVEVLGHIPKYEGNPYVIVGNRHGRHLVNLQKPWQIIRQAAGLGEVRLHDLRHTFASIAVASGGSLPMIGRMLGHSEPKTTQRYAHLTDDPIHVLTQTTGDVIAGALRRKFS